MKSMTKPLLAQDQARVHRDAVLPKIFPRGDQLGLAVLFRGNGGSNVFTDDSRLLDLEHSHSLLRGRFRSPAAVCQDGRVA
jgi:hypothetical protein